MTNILLKHQKTQDKGLCFIAEKKPANAVFTGFSGGAGGIRTHVGVNPNGFQDRLVMTASIQLRDP